jgi:hypothetical protein
MADDKTNPGKADRDRINVNEPYELRDAAEQYGVTQEAVQDAAKQVGR